MVIKWKADLRVGIYIRKQIRGEINCRARFYGVIFGINGETY